MKFIKIALGFIIFICLYFFNQGLYIDIVSYPSESDYGVYDSEFDGYLVDVRDTEQLVYENNSECTVYADTFTSIGLYNDACNLNNVNYVNEHLVSKHDQETFDNIYSTIYQLDYILAINEQNLNKVSGIDLVYTTGILNDIHINDYSKRDDIYFKFDIENYQTSLKRQNQLIYVCLIIVLIIFVSSLLLLNARFTKVMLTLGLSNYLIIKNQVTKLSISYFVSAIFALLVYFILTVFNGQLFFIDMFFEYFNLLKSILLLSLIYLLLCTTFIGILIVNITVNLKRGDYAI